MALPAVQTPIVEQSEVTFSPDLLKVSIRIPSEREYVHSAMLTLRGIGEHLAIEAARISRMSLALEEALLNTIEHAYLNGDGMIDVEFSVDSDEFALVVQDYGRGISSGAETRLETEEDILQDRGRGLHLVRGLPDRVFIGRNGQGLGTRTVMLFSLLGCG
jgi:serine/threonine-protein kinase RsbW